MARSEFSERDLLSLYFDLAPGQSIDLEVAAIAAVEWARALKAAALAIDPECDYRVNLVAAEPGSSRWLAKIEKSQLNAIAHRVQDGWHSVPLVLRMAVGLAVVIPTTAVPTYKFYMGDDGFSETQLHQIEETIRKVDGDPAVRAHRRSIYREAQKDKKIVGLGGGVATRKNWRPPVVIPSSQFAEAEGLFEPQEPHEPKERTLHKTLDVILVAPHLESTKHSWKFRQEGIPGTFSAEMKDVKFLSALERGIHEELRSNIPMTIYLEIKERYVDGEWKVKRRGRSVIEVISPSYE